MGWKEEIFPRRLSRTSAGVTRQPAMGLLAVLLREDTLTLSNHIIAKAF